MRRDKLTGKEREHEADELARLAQELSDTLLGIHMHGDTYDLDTQSERLASSSAMAKELLERVRKLTYGHSSPRACDVLGIFRNNS